MGELVIKNRKDQNLSVLIEKNDRNKGLVILMHGLGGYKELPLLKTLSETLNNLGYSTIRFDTTNSFGKSDGLFEDALTTNHYKDLEDVITWAKEQEFFIGPFILAGHSTGGLCINLFAAKNPSKVKAIILLSPPVSSNLNYEKCSEEFLDNWKKQGFFEWQDNGENKKLKWGFMEDLKKYNILKYAKSLTMPTLILSGEKDAENPIKHQRLLYNKLKCPKEMKIIKGGEHHLDKPAQLKEITKHIKNWIIRLDPNK